MSIISSNEVLKIAKISQIAVHESEIASLTHHLDQILSYAKRVSEVQGTDQQGIIKNSNVWRQDTVIPCNAEVILAQAPERADNFFVVPTILETV